MLAACPWVTLVATFVPQTMPQPTRPATVSRVAASSMFMPLTGARQSSSAELSSSQKQLCQQLAQAASGSTLSLNLNGCALHRARTRATTQTALASTHIAAHAQQLCAPRGGRSTRRSPLPALRTALSARRALRSALCSLLSLRTPYPNPNPSPNPSPNLSTSALAMLLALRSVWLSALRPPLSALRTRHTPPHAARRRTLHATCCVRCLPPYLRACRHTQLSLRRFESTRMAAPGTAIPCISLTNIEVAATERRRGHARTALRALTRVAGDSLS